MDHSLRSEWQTPAVVPAFDWIRSPRRQFEISLGAALATRTRGSARVRSPTSSWAIDTNGLPAWPNCSPTARQSLALPLQSRQFLVGRRSAEPCLAPKTEQNLLKLYNG